MTKITELESKDYKPIHLNIWKCTPKVILHTMPDENYNANNNAVELARLLTMTIPGSTLDIVYEAIVNEIKPMLESQDKINILKSNYDIENRIRIALNQIIQSNNIK
jgi:hypothetical protein